MNTKNTNNTEALEVVPTSPEVLDAQPTQRENFSQLAMSSPESQVAATRSEFDELFSFLEPPASEMEKEYRLHLFEVKNGYKRSRYDFGQALHTYWFWCLNTKQEDAADAQKATFSSLCDLIGVERRTAYNVMEDYKRAKNVHSDFRAVAQTLNIDLAERRNADLVGLLVAHPDLPRTADLQEKAAAIFTKAQENIAAFKQDREQKARAAQAEEAQKSNYTKLLEFAAKLYESKATVAEFRKDMEAVSKHLTSYLRADDQMPSKKQADDRNLAKS